MGHGWGGGAPGAAVAANRGGRHARARPDGEKQRARLSDTLLSAALLNDEAPLGGSAAPIGSVRQMSSIERYRVHGGMQNGEIILASMKP
jgi:hypothetical protein